MESGQALDVIRRFLVVLLIALIGWLGWVALGTWLSFRSTERIDPDIEGARAAIAEIPDDERPPPPPDEPEDPGDTAPPSNGPTTSTAPGSEPPATVVPDLPMVPSTLEPPPPAPSIPDDAFDAYLIIGSDRRPGLGGSRADVIILALFPDDGSAPMLVSLPRDLWIPNSCWERTARINASLNGCGEAASGPELLGVTVADWTGITPDHFALFDFTDFRRVIDAFGGIEICVNRPVRDLNSGLNLPAGCTDANGEEALSWVRSRRTEELRDGEWTRMRGVSDLTRNDRQRDVLLQLLGNLRSFRSIGRLTDVVDSLSSAVVIDEDLNVGAAIRLAWDLRNVSPASIIQIEIPVQNFRTEGGAAVLLPRKPFAEVLAEHWPA